MSLSSCSSLLRGYKTNLLYPKFSAVDISSCTSQASMRDTVRFTERIVESRNFLIDSDQYVRPQFFTFSRSLALKKNHRLVIFICRTSRRSCLEHFVHYLRILVMNIVTYYTVVVRSEYSMPEFPGPAHKYRTFFHILFL